MASGLELGSRGGRSGTVVRCHDSSSDELYITSLTATEDLISGFDSQSLLVRVSGKAARHCQSGRVFIE